MRCKSCDSCLTVEDLNIDYELCIDCFAEVNLSLQQEYQLYE